MAAVDACGGTTLLERRKSFARSRLRCRKGQQESCVCTLMKIDNLPIAECDSVKRIDLFGFVSRSVSYASFRSAGSLPGR